MLKNVHRYGLLAPVYEPLPHCPSSFVRLRSITPMLLILTVCGRKTRTIGDYRRVEDSSGPEEREKRGYFPFPEREGYPLV